MTASTDTQDSAYTRLHIAPFSSDLLRLVIPTSLQHAARNISYHTIETRPDQPYGFVDLPAADAERIRKKLNGAVLKGSKVRVEQAKIDTMPKKSVGKEAFAQPTEAKEKIGPRKEKGESKKRKRDAVVISAVQIEEGRKVKRGWTESSGTTKLENDDEEKGAKKQKKEKKDKADKKDKKEKEKKDKKDRKAAKQLKSRFSDGSECLVKTVIPAGKPMPELSGRDKKKKKGHEREVIVHEFEKTTGFPSFLRSSAATTSSAAETEYVEGVGWVDQDGKVVQPLRSSRPAPAKLQKKSAPAPAPAPADEDDSETSSSGESSSEDEDDGDKRAEAQTTRKGVRISTTTTQSDLPSETSTTLDSPRPKSSGSARNLSIKIPPPLTPAANKIHPLEALYKRSKPDATPGSQAVASNSKAFSFFGDGNEEGTPANGSHQAQPPMTPFTQEDFEWRNTRSAAPTPDTAHPNRTFKLWPRDDAEDDIAEEEEEDDEEGDGEDDGAEAAMTTANEAVDGGDEKADEAATGDFQSWFWEHRGDLNRSWKKRRKLAAKDKRYRDNKARAERAI